eukprot:TRINITY_DN3362_c0_g1_i1.p1 TRINITY_DN3362_c0_g1~~TRINITY_DN3362_c0_g1_i1.p1  ORF type:complete len:618 (+),score=82.81 TRINITY_DN3362_c0_g1_i1:32-1855(+)
MAGGGLVGVTIKTEIGTTATPAGAQLGYVPEGQHGCDRATLLRKVGQRFLLNQKSCPTAAAMLRQELVACSVTLDDKNNRYILPDGTTGDYQHLFRREVQRASLHTSDDFKALIIHRAQARRRGDFKGGDRLKNYLHDFGVTVNDRTMTFTLPEGETGEYDCSGITVSTAAPAGRDVQLGCAPEGQNATLLRKIGQRTALRGKGCFLSADILTQELLACGVVVDDANNRCILPDGTTTDCRDVMRGDRERALLHTSDDFKALINQRAELRMEGDFRGGDRIRNYLHEFGVNINDTNMTYALPTGETGEFAGKRKRRTERVRSGLPGFVPTDVQPSGTEAIQCLAQLHYSSVAADRLARERFAQENDPDLVQAIDAQLEAWNVSVSKDGGFWSHPDGTIRYECDFVVPLPPLKPRGWYGVTTEKLKLTSVRVQAMMDTIAELKKKGLDDDAQRKREELEARGVMFNDETFTWQMADGQEGAQNPRDPSSAVTTRAILTVWRKIQAYRVRGKEGDEKVAKKAQSGLEALQRQGCFVRETLGVWVTRDGRSGPLGELTPDDIDMCIEQHTVCMGCGDTDGASYWQEYLEAYGVGIDGEPLPKRQRMLMPG